jgi:hypothetical protein
VSLLRLVIGSVCVLAPVASFGQGASIDLSMGRLVYLPVSESLDVNAAIGTLTYESRQGLWVYGSTGVPLGSSSARWGATGVGGRLQVPASRAARVQIGTDTGAHAYLFRDAIATATGTGASVDVFPFVAVAGGAARLDVRGGWRGHSLSFAGGSERRSVVETGARASIGTTLRVQADANWVHAPEGTYPFAGGTASYTGEPWQFWLQAGKWLSPDLDDISWGAGIGVALGEQTIVWGRAWQEAPDRLYWNVARRSWGIGLTRRFGRPASSMPRVTPARSRVVFSIPVSEAQVSELWLAGDFNGWQPVAMAREGGAWVVRLPLDPGVYRYAFRSGEGRWFVPPSVRDRRDDGWGGQVAVLVVG